MTSRVEILTIGDELLRGELVDTNSSWLAEQLGQLGLRVTRFGSVGDDLDEVVAAFRRVSARCEAVIVSGGLGPTEDDRTAEALAAAAGVELALNSEQLEAIKSRFAAVGLPFTENNEKQAWLPRGADALDNDIGTAPGFTLRLADCRVVCLPGVPRELKRLFRRQVAPILQSELGGKQAELRRVKVFGLPEAQVDHRLRDLGEVVDSADCEVTLHYRATFPEIHVSAVVRGERAAEVADAYGDEIAARLGGSVFARDDTTAFADAVVAALGGAGATLALAESCTGGRAGDLITNAAGSSDVFRGGVIAYANEIKQRQLGVPGDVLEQHGAVSQACVEAMACGVRERFETTYGVAVSGIAGPGGGTPDKPVGTVHFALAGPEGVLRHLHRQFRYGERDRIKQLAAYVALWLPYRAVTAPDDDALAGDRWRPRGGERGAS